MTNAIVTGLGFYAGRTAARRFGEDMLLDINRISRAWESPPRTIFDIGANTGQSAKEYIRCFPDAMVHSFEPHPKTFEILARFASSKPRVIVHNLALGDVAGEVEFFEYENSSINSRIPDAAYPRRRNFTPNRLLVQQETLDQFCSDNDITYIDFMKIDTEGFDKSVLEGGKKMLSSGAIRMISCEVAISSEGRITTIHELVNILEEYGYKLFSTYIDFIVPVGTFFSNGNALFILPQKKV